MHSRLLVAALVTLGASCGHDPPTDVLDLEVVEASLSNPEVSGGGVAMGGMRITADLSVRDSFEGSHAFAVELSGLNLGGTGFWSSELNASDDSDLLGIGLDLPADGRPVNEDGGVGGPIRIRDLFESYSGAGFGMHAMLGGAVYFFSNEADVTIWLGGVTPGIGVTWGLVTLRMAVQN
ncbi:MAG: hypothetical protein ABIJ09_00090 [Pseudomonadota bacterium]